MSDRTTAFLREGSTPAAIPPLPWKIRPEEPLFFAGSCFASGLCRYWEDRFLPGRELPFGNVYNPASLREAADLLASGRKIRREELFLHRELWRHSLFDTARTHPDREALLGELNRALEESRAFLKGCRYGVLTLGTAWVYREREGGAVVGNCHKRPGSEFRRERLSPEEIRSCLGALRDALRLCAPRLRLILTLSPVRHLRDGAAENSLSKALLRCALEEMIRETEEAFYFPSYEIMIDELRDYRWYADDLTHPSERAVRYIMERFCEAAGAPELTSYLAEAEKLKRQRDHRLLFPDSPEGRRFREKREADEAAFGQRYPFARLPSER